MNLKSYTKGYQSIIFFNFNFSIMNKAIYLCAAAALALASCSNDETVEMAQQKGISFRAVTGLNTRASEVTTTNLSEILVTAFWDANNNKYDGFTNGEVLYKKDGNGDFNSAIPVYWPGKDQENEKLSFTAFSNNWTGNKTITDKNTISVGSVEINTDVDQQADMVYVTGVTGTKTANETSGVALTLKHALSQIQISAKSDNTVYTYQVKGIRISNVDGEANFDVVADKWSNNNANDQVYNVTYDNAITLSGTAQTIMKAEGNNLMLLPQGATTAWDVENDKQNANKGTYISVLLRITKTADNSNVFPAEGADTYGWAAVPASFTWEKGNKYVYTLNFTNGAGRVDPVTPGPDVKPQPDGKDPDKGDKILGDPIKFTVTVTPWNPQENNIGM